jgi:hypothetical protein
VGNAEIVKKTAELLTLRERSVLVHKVPNEAESIPADAWVVNCGDAEHTRNIATLMSDIASKRVMDLEGNILEELNGSLADEAGQNGIDN